MRCTSRALSDAASSRQGSLCACARRRAALIVAVVLVGCVSEPARLSVRPNTMQAQRWAETDLVLSGPQPSAYLETTAHGLTLARDVRVRVGDVTATAVEAGGYGVRARLSAPLAVGTYDVVMHSRGIDWVAAQALTVWESDGGVPQLEGGAGDAGDGGDLGLDSGIDSGPDAGSLPPETIVTLGAGAAHVRATALGWRHVLGK